MTDWIRETSARFLSLFRKRSMDADLEKDLASHVDLLTSDNQQRGMTPEEARRQALVAMGGLTAAKELHRDTRGLPWLDTLMQDVKYSFRTLRRDAGLTTFAIIIVGLGVGASSTVFNLFNALLLRPLPFSEPDRLAWISNGRGEGMSARTIQSDYILDMREQSKSFSDVAAYYAFYGVGDSRMTGVGQPERLTGVPVTQNFFPLLGVEPKYGRNFSKEESQMRGPRAILLSHRFWERRFASDPNVVGNPVVLDGDPFTIVGVLPESFDFGSIFAPGRQIDIFMALPLAPEINRQGNTSFAIGRLKPGASIETANSELAVLGKNLTEQHRERNNFVPTVVALRDQVSGSFRSAMVVLSCAVAVLMLVVCANLSNLLLARAVSREREMAVRAALGAAKGRLIRQMLTESLVLSLAGSFVGLVLAIVGTRLLTRLDTVGIPLLLHARVDGTALAFVVLAAVVTGIVFGLTPALRTSRISINGTLKESGRGTSEAKGHGLLRSTLVVSEIALACVLLVGAGLLIRSFLRVLDVNLGFRPESAVTMRVDPSRDYRTIEQRNAYFDEMLRRAGEIPGVQAAALTDSLPLGRNRTWGAPAKGQTYPRGEFPLAFVRVVSDGYFKAMGIPVRSGRDFTPRDTPSSQEVIIINEALAKRLWPGQNPIGQIMNVGRDRQVIGVVGNVRHLALEKDSGSEMYLPIRQTRDYSSVDIVVRAAGEPATLANAIRTALRPLDPELPANEFRTLEELVDRSVSPRRLVVWTLGGFAAAALVLASLGIYAVISYSVNRKKAEIGIRMALGESSGGLQARIVWQTLKLAIAGIAAGTVVSWLGARFLQDLLFGVKSSDPLTFSAMLFALLAVALAAGYVPARRASRMNPLDALRAE
jgi:predicted permease